MLLAMYLVSAGIFAGLGAAYWLGRRPSRALPESVRSEIAQMPPRRKNQHLVDLVLRDGRVVRKVWIAYGSFPAVIGGRMFLAKYRPSDVVQVVPHERRV